MPALQVKDCPSETYELLRERSARENRSISQQTLTIIEQYLGLRDPDGADSRSRDVQPLSARFAAEEPDAHFLERRQAIFERINDLPSFRLPDGFDDVSDLVTLAREERW